MKLIWVTNIELPIISKEKNKQPSVYGGWLDYLSRALIERDDCEMVFLYPSQTFQKLANDRFIAYSFPKNCDEKIFIEILKKEKPSLIHIFGTEAPHLTPVIRAIEICNLLDNTVLSIQGIIFAYYYHYLANIPPKVSYRFGIKELAYRKNLIKEKNAFFNKGLLEKKALSKLINVQGRTDWDFNSVKIINPQINYFKCGEILRDIFYKKKWSYDKMIPHRIFVSQSNYPLKGLHYLLQAIPFLIDEFPNIHIYCTGNDIINDKKTIFKSSSYQRYLRKLIKSYGIEKKVHFVGFLNEEEMCNQYLKANVFVSPSSIENSSNSIGEAMLVGCPTIASNVGGTASILTHEKEGFLYQSDAPYLLAYFLRQLFIDKELCLNLSENSKLRALKNHDKIQIVERQVEIYNLIKKNEGY